MVIWRHNSDMIQSSQSSEMCKKKKHAKVFPFHATYLRWWNCLVSPWTFPRGHDSCWCLPCEIADIVLFKRSKCVGSACWSTLDKGDVKRQQASSQVMDKENVLKYTEEQLLRPQLAVFQLRPCFTLTVFKLDSNEGIYNKRTTVAFINVNIFLVSLTLYDRKLNICWTRHDIWRRHPALC